MTEGSSSQASSYPMHLTASSSNPATSLQGPWALRPYLAAGMPLVNETSAVYMHLGRTKSTSRYRRSTVEGKLFSLLVPILRKTASEFFEGVCAPCNARGHLRDPPLSFANRTRDCQPQ